MKKKWMVVLATVLALSGVFAGCSSNGNNADSEAQSQTQEEKNPAELAGLSDGRYKVKFETDSKMFHVNEAKKDLADLTVKDGKMTVHVTLAGRGYTRVFLGTAEDAKNAKDGDIFEHTEDVVKYEDGTEDTAFGFDIPVKELDKDIQLAVYGPKKDKWYDHTVTVSLVKQEEEALADGEYEVNLTLEGGSGKATIESPVIVTALDGKLTARLVWSSKNYDYMVVDGVKYLNEAEAGNPSVFTIPVPALSCDLNVIGDTVAMGNAHEIEYVLHLEKR